MVSGSRGWCVSTNTGAWYGGSSPHQPFQPRSHSPRPGLNMLRPMTYAPAACFHSSKTAWSSGNRSKCHSCRSIPPSPSGLSALCLGPATKPSSDVDRLQVTFVIESPIDQPPVCAGSTYLPGVRPDSPCCLSRAFPFVALATERLGLRLGGRHALPKRISRAHLRHRRRRGQVDGAGADRGRGAACPPCSTPFAARPARLGRPESTQLTAVKSAVHRACRRPQIADRGGACGPVGIGCRCEPAACPSRPRAGDRRRCSDTDPEG